MVALTLTDIDVLTLGDVLEHLLFIDLCRVAEVSTHLREAARIEFSRRYWHRNFKLSLNEIVAEDSDEHVDIINVFGLKNSLTALRCFGDLILNLHLDFTSGSSFQKNKLWLYFNEYCYTSVVVLHIGHAQFELQTSFQKSFINMREITFICCDFNSNLFAINHICPKLSSIDFDGWNILSFDDLDSYMYEELNDENMKKLLDMK